MLVTRGKWSTTYVLPDRVVRCHPVPPQFYIRSISTYYFSKSASRKRRSISDILIFNLSDTI